MTTCNYCNTVMQVELKIVTALDGLANHTFHVSAKLFCPGCGRLTNTETKTVVNQEGLLKQNVKDLAEDLLTKLVSKYVGEEEA